MSHGKNVQAEPLPDEELQLRVQQGLQKRKKCALCLQTFYVDELPGAITHKSILELRHKWGIDIRRGNRLPPPSLLYKREDLCVFCMQFFEADGSFSSDRSGSPGKEKTVGATNSGSQMGGTAGSSASGTSNGTYARSKSGRGGPDYMGLIDSYTRA